MTGQRARRERLLQAHNEFLELGKGFFYVGFQTDEILRHIVSQITQSSCNGKKVANLVKPNKRWYDVCLLKILLSPDRR